VAVMSGSIEERIVEEDAMTASHESGGNGSVPAFETSRQSGDDGGLHG